MKTFLILLLTILLTNFVFAQENGGPYTPDENTVLLMHFEDNVENFADVGINGILHGSGVSYETSVDGHGKCIRLDNSTSDKQSWIEVPFYDELNFTDEFSIECWFKINSWKDVHTKFPFILKKGESWQSDYELLFDAESEAFASNLNCVDDDYGRDAEVRTTDIIEAQEWYHIAIYFNYAHRHFYMILRDENFKEIYANHRYTYTQAFNSNDKLFIGFGNSGESFFDGCIDEIRISNKYRKFRDDIVSEINTSELKDSVSPLLNDKWQVYQWPLAEHFPVSSETEERHKGNSCGITAILRLIHYWEHPRQPIGNIDFIESGYNWKADFDNTQYLFDEMLDVFPPGTAPEEYASAATLSAHIGAAAHLPGTWIGSGGAAIQTILERYFLYSKKLTFIYREEYTKQEWEKIFKNELSNGRPILIEGTAERFDNGNWAGHFYICDGYSSDNKFHSDMSMGVDQWYDIDNFDYGQNQCALIFAEPDWGNKELELIGPSSNKTYKAGSDIEIRWTSANISNLILEYSSDAGKNWKTISDEVDASSGTYTWSVPQEISKTYKVRISDKEDLNVYRKTNQFEVYNTKSFDIEYPQLNTKFKSGTRQPVYWNSTGISAIKLEYSIDGQNWILINDSVSASDGQTFVKLPDTVTDNIVLKATDINEPEQTFTSEKFKLITEQLWGGPYEVDDNTLLLMHFENNTSNEVKNQLLPIELNPIGIYEENFSKNQGKAFRIYNSDQFTGDAFHVKNSENLDLGNNWTMEAWVKVTSIGGERNVASLIFNKWDVFAISAGWQYFGGFVNFENGTKVEFRCPQKYTLNKWYHVAMISDATKETVSFYVHDKNAQIVYHDEKPFPEGSNGMVLKKEFINDGEDKNLVTIGGLGGGSNFELDGYLDEVRITKSSKLMDYIETVELPFYDDFEEQTSDDGTFTKWTTQNLEGWQYWHVITGQGVNYSKCMRFENNDADQNDWLITRAIDCSGTNQLKINFDVLYNGTGVKPQLFYKSLNKTENSATEWVELNYSMGAEENKWYSIDEITINNPGDIIYFAFNSNQKANQGIYFLLDNFNVKGDGEEQTQLSIRQIQGETDTSPYENQKVKTKGRIIALNQYGFFLQDATAIRSGIWVYAPELVGQFNQGERVKLTASVKEYKGKTELLEVDSIQAIEEEIPIYLLNITAAQIGENYESVFVKVEGLKVIYKNQYEQYMTVSPAGDSVKIDNFLIQPEMEIGKTYDVAGIVDFRNGSFCINPRGQAGIKEVQLHDPVLSPYQAASEMKHGINLGNTMEPPTEASWNNPKAQEYYFDLYKEAGFDVVRIPVRWDNYTSKSFPYKIDNEWLNRVEELVDWGLERDLYIVINAHHEDWLKENYDDPDFRVRFDSIWSQVATHFKDKSEKLIFEIFNEPTTQTKGLTVEENNEVNARIISIIRKTNPTRIIIFQGNDWSSSYDLFEAAVPDDNYLIGTYHSYFPYEFALLGQGTFTEQDYNNLRNEFINVKNWSDVTHIPVFLGEFGSLKSCDYNSRMKQYHAYVALAQEYNVIPCAWDDGGNFRIFERQQKYWNEVKDILIYAGTESPDNLSLEVFQDSIVKVTWNNVITNNDSIFIERRKSTDTSYKRIATLNSGETIFYDVKPEPENTYHYRIIAHFNDTTDFYSYPQKLEMPFYVTSVDLYSSLKNKFNIYPNPATSESVISFQTQTRGKVNLSIFDLQGRKIYTLINEKLNAGIHTIPIANSLPASGVYLCKLTSIEGISTKKLIVNSN